MDRSPYAIEATETSIRILERLVDAERRLGITQLASDLDLSKSVVHNHLSTLEQLGYVENRDGEYCPALRPLALGERTRAAMRVYQVGRRDVDNLAEATGEVVLLVVEEAGSGVPIQIASGSNGWSLPYCIGERVPLHVNAPGKAILASLSDERIESILAETPLETPTDRTVGNPDELRRQLRTIDDDEASFSREEHFPDIISVGAPIRSPTDQRSAALGIVGPADRLNGRYLEEDLSGQVISTAKSIGVALRE